MKSARGSGSVKALVRPRVARLERYDSPRHHYTFEERGGTPLADSLILLDANESPYSVLDAGVKIRWDRLNRYADPLATDLREALAKRMGCGAENVFVGNGTDEVIDLLVRAFAGPGDSVIVFPPTYQIYSVCAGMNGAKVIEVPLDKEFQPDVRAIMDAIEPSTKILFLCSPNQPTGNLMDRRGIESLAEKLKQLIVVDEAYAEFAGGSVVDLAGKFDNLVVLRTFSKAWGLAAIRVGYAVAGQEVIEALRRVKLPYNVSAIAQDLALQALENEGRLAENVARVLQERERLAEGLRRIGLRVFPSDANYLFVQLPHEVSAREVYDKLADGGIIVRDRSAAVENCFRITVGTREENLALIDAIQKAML